MLLSQAEVLVAGPLLVIATLWLASRSRARKLSDSIPSYGQWWLPSFAASLLAAYRLGTDEETFLLDCHRRYGPIVYLPWPLSQYLVTDSAAVQSIYSTPAKSLVFMPIRNQINATVFDNSLKVYQSRVLEKEIFPAHTKGLVRGQLPQPLARFVASIEQKIVALGERVDKEGGNVKIELVDVINEMVFDGATDALFGPELCSFAESTLDRQQLRHTFIAFDSAFPLLVAGLAAGLLPRRIISLWPRLAKGVAAREVLVSHFSTWIKAGMPGLEEGAIRGVVEAGQRTEIGEVELGKVLLSAFWALQANAPYAAVHQLLYLTQSPLLPSVRAEMDHYLSETASPYSFDTISSSTTLPLLTSTLQETLRLAASSFSIRLVMERDGFVFPGSSQAIPPIPYHSRIICCATRLLDVEGDDDSAQWDGERFVGEEGRRKAAREVRAFGGGVSICEGRALALAMLKVVSVMLLSEYDLTPLSSDAAEKDTRELLFRDGVKGSSPRTISGRAGMGVRQVISNAPYRISRRASSS